eukprot:167674-Alexandrium_andersonii.AAC.1
MAEPRPRLSSRRRCWPTPGPTPGRMADGQTPARQARCCSGAAEAKGQRPARAPSRGGGACCASLEALPAA